MNRRNLLKTGLKLYAALMITSAAFLLTGCFDQTVVAALLGEMSTAWQGFETALGRSLPASVTTAFTTAIAAVKAWVPGTPAQDVVQVLQILSTAIGSFVGVGSLTGLEAAAVSVILGTIVNIIEIIDPNAVPPAVATARFHLQKLAKPPVPQKHFRQGGIPASDLKKQFEIQWLAVTGKAAA